MQNLKELEYKEHGHNHGHGGGGKHCHESSSCAKTCDNGERGKRAKPSRHDGCGCGGGHEVTAEETKRKIVQLAAGAVIFAVGMILRAAIELNFYIELSIFLLSYLILGGEIVLRAIKNILRGKILDENFLMTIATVGAFALKEFPEGVAVMLFYQVGEFFQEFAVRKSKKSITALMDIRPDYANLIKDGKTTKVKPETVEIGDILEVRAGEKIPLDGVVIEGTSFLDTAALTGEAAPREVKTGDAVLSGCVSMSGLLTVRVTKLFGESTVAKILDLVENASAKKAPTENFITKFAKYYTPFVVCTAVLLAVLPPLFFDGAWTDWINRALIFLVISCPCALVVSIPLSFFGGIGAASKSGVLIKGSNYLEALNNLDIVVFDKTGTLTKGEFSISKLIPSENTTKEELLEYAVYAEYLSNHPIAKSVVKAYGKPVNKTLISDYTEIAGQGISVNYSGKSILAGNYELMLAKNIDFKQIDEYGTKVYVAVDNLYIGCVIVADEVKPDSKSTVAQLKSLGISKTVMLTGDNKKSGERIAAEIGIDEVYTQLLPQDKVAKLEMLNAQKRKGGKLAFAGDGINDAPVLARADIGIAMGGLGSDAAIEAADIVLMTDEPSKLVSVIRLAKRTKAIVWQNIIFALGIKAVFLLLGAFGIATMWEAVFADVGVSLLAVLNAMRVMKTK